MRPMINWPTKFQLNPIGALSSDAKTFFTNPKPRKCSSNERLRNARNELAHHIWVQSDRQCICKWAGTARPNRIQERRKLRAWPKDDEARGDPLMSSLLKLKLNLISGLSANTRRLLDQSEIVKWPEFRRVGYHNECIRQVWDQSPGRFAIWSYYRYISSLPLTPFSWFVCWDWIVYTKNGTALIAIQLVNRCICSPFK